MRTLFLTGASGFVGRQFTADARRAGWSVIALSRTPPTSPSKDVRWIAADLGQPERYRDALAGVDAVLHLAAAVGKASPAEFQRVNVDGTRILLDACADAGIDRFLFVSSIAARFQDKAYYHYATSKQEAEAVVSAGTVNSLIVRPTIVLGAGSPIGDRFRALGTAPVVPVFGNGRARIQPIHVDDLSALLLHIVEEHAFDGRILELGGPEVLTMEDLLRRIHEVARGRSPRVLHVPVGALRHLLGGLERISTALAPVTAGQLASFCNDGVATTGIDEIRPGHVLITIDEMIRQLLA